MSCWPALPPSTLKTLTLSSCITTEGDARSMRLNRKIAIAVGAATLTIGGVAAAAVTAPPEAADKGLMTAEEHTGTELPASKDDHPTQADHPGGGNEVATEDAEEGAGAVDNHGADLSAVAQGDTTGRDHGAAVSEVASDGHAGGQGDAQGQAPVATPNDGGIGTGSEASDDANATGAEHAADQAAAGSANAGEHGRP